MEDSGEGEGELEELIDCTNLIEGNKSPDTNEEDTPVISLHALWGIEGCQTMKVVGKIEK